MDCILRSIGCPVYPVRGCLDCIPTSCLTYSLFIPTKCLAFQAGLVFLLEVPSISISFILN
jgi:hypothetical protein